jgi:hypothetical protein
MAITNTIPAPRGRNIDPAPSSAFGLRQVTISLIWALAAILAAAMMGGLLVQAVVGRMIAAAIVLIVALVLHLSMRPSKPPPAPKAQPKAHTPTDVIDRIHRQILGSGAAGATAIRR